MTAPTPTRPLCQDRPKSHAHAADSLDDAPFIVYVLLQMFKLGTALFVKRWPHLG